MKTLLRWLLSAFVITAGIGHFVVADDFRQMVPAWLPWAALLVVVSGVAEIAGGIGLQLKATRKAAAWGLIALFIAVFPANVNMAVHNLSPSNMHMPPWALWARLPFQVLFIAWAHWYTREP